MVKAKKQIASALSFVILILIVLGAAPFASAATSTQMNDDSVFLKQQTSYTCTLASMAMAMRRTALAMNVESWEMITEQSIKSKAWVEGVGLLWSFTVFSMKIGHGDFPSNDKAGFLKELLQEYPQGVVAYNEYVGGQEHAVFITDYDEATDTFYAADPANSTPVGRIKLSETSIVGSTQSDKIGTFGAYWCVTSPKIYSSGAESIQNSLKNYSTQAPASSGASGEVAAFAKTQKQVSATYMVSDRLSGGVAVRNAPTASGDIVRKVEYGTELSVTASGTNSSGAQWYKLSDGNYIYSGNVTQKTQFVRSVQTSQLALGELTTVPSLAQSESCLYYCSVNASALNLREKPTTDSRILAEIPNKTELTVTAVTADWGYVSYGGHRGWINLSFVNNVRKSGDVNGDGKVSATDARLVLRYSAKLETFSDAQISLSDIDGDGKITANDARKVMLISAKLLVQQA